MVGTALPATPNFFDESASLAYARILPLEEQASVKIRILGWMMYHAPSSQGRASVAEIINRCATNEAIIKFGTDNLFYFVNYFKNQATRPTPPPSSHPSRQSVDDLRAQILDTLQPTPMDHRAAKDQALVRDDYRCMLTGLVDMKSYNDSPYLRAQIENLPPPGPDLVYTECCHILPHYIGHRLITDARAEASAAVQSVIELFGGIPADEVNGAGIHHLGNVMTLDKALHTAFDNLVIWLEPVEGFENRYFIRRKPRVHSSLPQTVTFNAQGNLPLPDPRYLALHASCARVVHLSGAGEFIDKVLHDFECTKVLSEDGSSSDLLDHLLSAESCLVC